MEGGKRVAWLDRRSRVEELLRRHEVEKLPLKQIAMEAGIPMPTLYAWVRRLRREPTSAAKQARSERSAGFIELKAPGDSCDLPSATGIELSLRSGVCIRVAESFHEPTLKRLLVLLGV
jgi:transposase-like protein